MVLHVLLVSKLPVLHLFRLCALLWPFNLFLPLARQLQRVCTTLSTASALFVFRLRRIAAAERHGTRRFERAVRLVSEQLRLRPVYTPNAEYSVLALFALSL